jgi:biofilm PGA synthesis N-glycosyltransferase PgaC
MMEGLIGVLRWIDHTLVYRILLWFYGLYPVLMACVWVVLSLFFWTRRERNSGKPKMQVGPQPLVSVIIAAYEEEHSIARTLDAVLNLNYPSYEVVVVDDGSSDRTSEIVRSYLDRGSVRLVLKTVNEGKAMALNDALPICRGEILLLIDADIVVTPDLLNNMVPHFRSSRVAAVTGNPRVANRQGLLKRLQAIEFSSIISMQRRAQRIWGRVMTVSGAVVAFRRSAILDVGLFTPSMATEDIDMTWRLQMRFWDVRYEPRAVVWMEVPPNLRELWKQRRRWVRGLAQVLRHNRSVPLHWKWRRLWPVFYESTISILWAFTFVGITLYWLICLAAGYHPYGASPIPNFWGMLIATACIIQLIAGALEDRKYDPKIAACLPEAIYYPLIYWTLMSTITCLYTIGALFRKPPQMQRWKIQRSAA